MRNRSSAIALILASINLTACGTRNPIPISNVCRKSEIGFKEDVLRQDLKVMRDRIDTYTTDKEKRPQTLHDLVDGGYLRKIPGDPFTGSAQTWQVEKSAGKSASIKPNSEFRKCTAARILYEVTAGRTAVGEFWSAGIDYSPLPFSQTNGV